LTMKEVNKLRVVQGYMDGKIEMEEASRILKRHPFKELSFKEVGRFDS
jgi:hypothetical protein